MTQSTPQADIETLVKKAGTVLAPVWPLRSFVARNPLMGLQELGFEAAVEEGERLFDGRGYPSRSMGQKALETGHIAEHHLQQAYEACMGGNERAIMVGYRRIYMPKFLWAVMTGEVFPGFGYLGTKGMGLPYIAEKMAPLLPYDPPPARPDLRINEADRFWDGRKARFMEKHIAKWMAAYLDEGQAAFPMPGREQGLYKAWLDLAPHDSRLIRHLDAPAKKTLKTLTRNPFEAIDSALNALKVLDSEREDYLRLHLTRLPGWAGFIKWRAEHPHDDPWQTAFPVDLVGYLAMRLSVERLLLDTASRKNGDLELVRQSENRPDARVSMKKELETVLNLLAQYAGVKKDNLDDLTPSNAQEIIRQLRAFQKLEGKIWLQAWEQSYQEVLMDRLASGLKTAGHRDDIDGIAQRPLAQVVFCIDVRSEPFRRHLEETGLYDTYGYAGFFGVPMKHTPLGEKHGISSCPVLLQPSFHAAEQAEDGQKAGHSYSARLRIQKRTKILLRQLKNSVGAAFAYVEAIGVLYIPFISLRTLAPVWGENFFDRASSVLLRKPRTSPYEFDFMTVSQKANFVGSMLKLTGMLKADFGRFVMLCGHGSRTSNKSHASALDCGACGGHEGAPNARTLARIANDPEVRTALQSEGIVIPEDTVFIAAQHNTTTDEVDIFDGHLIPETHQSDLAILQKDLTHARMATAAERARRLGGRGGQSPIDFTMKRSRDWAQVRPEWGLAGNAAFIIAPRQLSRAVDLEGRVFLHSYDWSIDNEAALLETIMTAPMIVTQWINNQYYFSCTDVEAYGAANKTWLNVTGTIGVLKGNGGDLKPGLALQSLYKTDTEIYHEPLRLMVVIQAPIERVKAVIGKHAMLQTLFDGQWIGLTVIDPTLGNTAKRYRPDTKRWENWGGFAGLQ